jgi:hypothetical protein
VPFGPSITANHCKRLSSRGDAVQPTTGNSRSFSISYINRLIAKPESLIWAFFHSLIYALLSGAPEGGAEIEALKSMKLPSQRTSPFEIMLRLAIGDRSRTKLFIELRSCERPSRSRRKAFFEVSGRGEDGDDILLNI